MADVMRGRYTARIDGDFVVFLIGMRINRPLRVRKWVPMARKMGPMLKALAEDPASGLLSFEFGWMNRGPALVQYWRSFEHLDRFAKDPGMPHLPAWRWYNQAIKSSGDVAIWHETYQGPCRRVRDDLRESQPLRAGQGRGSPACLTPRADRSRAHRGRPRRHSRRRSL